ncbi:hypothetical protein DFH09DRAFT_1369792 [Mycena vulgaris]|nr:hypothetical protein DFH09DRAFT_1369792 [Mycena vulgaris]
MKNLAWTGPHQSGAEVFPSVRSHAVYLPVGTGPPCAAETGGGGAGCVDSSAVELPDLASSNSALRSLLAFDYCERSQRVRLSTRWASRWQCSVLRQRQIPPVTRAGRFGKRHMYSEVAATPKCALLYESLYVMFTVFVQYKKKSCLRNPARPKRRHLKFHARWRARPRPSAPIVTTPRNRTCGLPASNLRSKRDGQFCH